MKKLQPIDFVCWPIAVVVFLAITLLTATALSFWSAFFFHKVWALYAPILGLPSVSYATTIVATSLVQSFLVMFYARTRLVSRHKEVENKYMTYQLIHFVFAPPITWMGANAIVVALKHFQMI